MFQWETLCILGRMQQFIVEIHKGTLKEDEKHGRKKEKKKHWKKVKFAEFVIWTKARSRHTCWNKSYLIRQCLWLHLYMCMYVCVFSKKSCRLSIGFMQLWKGGARRAGILQNGRIEPCDFIMTDFLRFLTGDGEKASSRHTCGRLEILTLGPWNGKVKRPK